MATRVDIYYIQDPISLEIRYIGRSISFKDRKLSHLRACRKGTYPRLPLYLWMKKKIKRGYAPIFGILQSFEFIQKEEAYAAETYWIKYFKALGAPLLNMAPKGNGGCCKMTPIIDSNGIIYESASEVARSLRISETQIRDCIKNPKRTAHGLAFAAFTENSQIPVPYNRKIVDNFGNIYNSVKEASLALNISRCAISTCLSSKNNIRTAFGMAFAYYKIGAPWPIYYPPIRKLKDQNGRIYKSMNEASKVLGIPRHLIDYRLRRNQQFDGKYQLSYV